MVLCPRCGISSLLNIRQLLDHIASSHSNESSFDIICSLPKLHGNCCAVFRSLSKYRCHIYKYHSALLLTDKIRQNETGTCILCPICGSAEQSLRAMSTHYRIHCDDGIPVKCLVRHCHKTFGVVSSYTAHMSRIHKNVTLAFIRDDLKKYLDVAEPVQPEPEYDSCPVDLVEDTISEPRALGAVEMPCTIRNTALLFLKMKSQYFLADSTIQSIVGDFSDCFEVSSSVVRQHIRSVCVKYALPEAVSTELRCAVENDSLKNAVSNLSTEWKRNAYYKETFPFISPTEYRYTNNSVTTKETFQYISMIETLKTLLKNNDIRSQILNPEPGIAGHLNTLKDGTMYKMHIVFSQVQNSLEIILYSDEFQIVNPLGPHRKKHKILAFYFTSGNLHSRCKSQKSAMFLLALCKSCDIQKHGFSRIAEIINSELTILETTGIDAEGFPNRLRGALAFIARDNLNNHIIGGFNACFSPNVLHPCRFCMISNVDMRNIRDGDCLNVRTRDSYNQQVTEVEQDESLASVYGIRSRSLFISGSFHVADGLPPDIMHDLLEGVIPFEMALILKVLLSKDYFSLEDLNHSITHWPYGPLDKRNKPVVIASTFGDSISQNAGRTWCLLRLLPLMIGSKVPESDLHWQFFLELKNIAELVFAPRLAVGNVILMQRKIQDHLESFCELFPARLLKPKQHFLLHYAQYMLMYGPLRLCWCMR